MTVGQGDDAAWWAAQHAQDGTEDTVGRLAYAENKTGGTFVLSTTGVQAQIPGLSIVVPPTKRPVLVTACCVFSHSAAGAIIVPRILELVDGVVRNDRGKWDAAAAVPGIGAGGNGSLTLLWGGDAGPSNVERTFAAYALSFTAGDLTTSFGSNVPENLSFSCWIKAVAE